MTLNAKAMVFLASTAKQLGENCQSYRQAIPSPCMSVCLMDPELELCQGCLRTLDEIVQWGSADEAVKRSVWAAIESRITRYS
ncbi:DUF1289 domain-containing protein [Rhodoferax sp.]|jgi:predicted Fe-S protein YdhL (DUF1289 family)|uniref:DUF1289 domain-containing protein n=1 Tax=Rhodoferax sp. TaxID=50421 RepID=UPI00342DB5E2